MRLAGVPLELLECWVIEHDYQIFDGGVEDELERRTSLLNWESRASTKTINDEAATWKNLAGILITAMHAFQQAVLIINQRYFDGEEIMFSDLAKSLADLTKYTEDLVSAFNDHVAKMPEDKLDLEVLRKAADTTVAGRVSYLVDMAKAEALDALGENRAAVELIQRHLGVMNDERAE